MKYTGVIFCLVVGLAVAKAFSVSGFPSLNETGISDDGSQLLPKNNIPDSRLRSLLFGHSTSVTSTNTNTNTNNIFNRTMRLTSSSNIRKFFNIPIPQTLTQNSSSAANTSNSQIPQNFVIPDLGDLESIPGLSSAIESAREHLTQALELGTNFTAGIEQAVQDALSSGDSTAAILRIVNTIVNTYLEIAENCPLMIIKARVIQEGIRLATEVAKSGENVLLGTTTAASSV